MREEGFVTWDAFKAHRDKDWRVVHGIVPKIRGVVPVPRGGVGAHTHVKADVVDTPWSWGDVLKTGSNLTDLATRQHAGLTDVTHSQHHNKLHSMTGDQHSAAGLTVGYVLRATGAATFAWGWLTKLGTVNTGVWQGTPVANAYVAGIDQNLLTISSPTHVTAKLTALTDGYVPYHVSDATGLANSPIRIDGANIGIGKVPTCKLDVNGIVKADTFHLAAGVTPNLAWLSDVVLGALEEGETLSYDQGTEKWIDAWGVEYDNPRLVWKMYTDFLGSSSTINPPWDGTTISGGTGEAGSGEANHPGIIRFYSLADTANSGYSFLTHYFPIIIAGREHSEFVFKTPPSLSTVYGRFGFQNSKIVTLPTNGIYINITGTTLTGKTRKVNAESTTGTSYPLSVNTWYRGTISVNDDTDLVTFSLYEVVAGEQVVKWTNTLATNIPTGTLGHGAVMYSSGTGGILLAYLDMMVASQAGYITR